FERIDRDLATPATGMSILAGLLSSRNIDSMINGTILSLILVSIVMVFSLGKLSYGFISLLPNVMPILLAYGAWGLFVGEVSFAGAMVCAMTFGIVVDDTVHFMNKYRFLREVRLLNPVDAMAEVFRTVGSAIVVTTFAIGLGFCALAMSGFLVNQHLGMLTAITLGSALVADLLFLPALLYLLDRGDDMSSKSQTIGRTQIHLPETGAAFLVDVDRPSMIFPVKDGTAKVGRHPENDVILTDPTVHRHHAILTRGLGKAYQLQDLSPPHGNGIWVNGKRAREADIVPGDLIELGEMRLRYVSA
ncbi:MAG: FHA domain-containing protein, partial [Pseudomonadota bacterium]